MPTWKPGADNCRSEEIHRSTQKGELRRGGQGNPRSIRLSPLVHVMIHVVACAAAQFFKWCSGSLAGATGSANKEGYCRLPSRWIAMINLDRPWCWSGTRLEVQPRAGPSPRVAPAWPLPRPGGCAGAAAPLETPEAGPMVVPPAPQAPASTRHPRSASRTSMPSAFGLAVLESHRPRLKNTHPYPPAVRQRHPPSCGLWSGILPACMAAPVPRAVHAW